MKKIKGFKSLLFILLIFSMTFASLVGCSNETKSEEPSTTQEVDEDNVDKESSENENKETDKESKGYTFKDQNDHEVKIPGDVERIVVLQHHTLDVLAMLGAQDKVVGVVDKWESLLGDYMKDVFKGIEDLPKPGSLETCNIEEVASLKPDLVIVAAQFDEAQVKQLEELDIPVMTLTFRGEGKQEMAQNPELQDADVAYTTGLEWAINKLGELTGTQEKAEELWDFAMDSRKYVEDNLKDIPEDDKLNVFIANEKNMTYGSDKYVGTQMERAGAINVAAKDIEGYKEVNFEKVAEWNPDVIVVQDRYKDVYDEIKSDSKWKNIKAVKDDKVILAPYWTKPWGNPGPDSIALGELWFAHKFYPEQINKAEVEKKVDAFYKEFYQMEFDGTI